MTKQQERRNWFIRPLFPRVEWPAFRTDRQSAGLSLLRRSMRRWRRLFVCILVTFAAPVPSATWAASADPLQSYIEERDRIIAGFRIDGQLDLPRLADLEKTLRSLSDGSSGGTQVRATLELGRVQRLRSDFATALTTLTRAAGLASSQRLSDVVFDAWIEITRIHLNNAQDHGAAAAAFELAETAAGVNPTPKQRFNLIAYQAQLLAARGEVEAALVDTLLELDSAPTPEDRFFAELDAADAVLKVAATCDYRKLQDARSVEDNDGWGACRRAYQSAAGAYEQAARTAENLNWPYMADQMLQFRGEIGLRQQLLESRARGESLWSDVSVFSPREPGDVLVSTDFSAGAEALPEFTILADLAEHAAAADEARRGGLPDARNLYVRSLAADIRAGSGREPDLLVRAADLLAAERESFLDPRRRGTVIESRIGIINTLALRLLALGREAEAFAAFESARARGLEELTQALARPEVTQADRSWLAKVFTLEARESEIETAIVEDVVAGGDLKVPADRSKDLEALRAELSVELGNGEAILSRISLPDFEPTSLDELRGASAAAGIPVMLYWTTPTAVVAWYVGPHGSQVRSIFLPEEVLADKIDRVLATSVDDSQAFDETAARELYFYLVTPFEHLLDSQQVLIIPQGPLFVLPFETLIGPETGTPLIEQWTVSYAPNAGRALAALTREIPQIRQVTAVVDTEVDDATEETKGIAAATGLKLRILPSIDIPPAGLAESVTGAESLHLLMHGEFNPIEPLLSELRLGGRDPILAAELVGLPIQGLRLAVLSACESARVGQRISNEIFGFTWALLAGGAETVVLSRWLVQGDSNGIWMRLFYAALEGGSSPAQAAAEAMRGMRRDGFTHPYYWAAMQVSGR